MTLRIAQSNFSKGEIAPELLGRFDVPTYQAALARARNVCILKYGGITKRPGTRVIGEVYDDSLPLRLIPFQFSLEQAYALEFGHTYMRPMALGGFILEENLKITAITKAAQAQVTIAYHAYEVGDEVFFTGITGMVEMNGRVGRVVSVQDDNNFTVDISSIGFTTFIDSTGTVRVGAPDPPPDPPDVPPPPEDPEPPDTWGGGGFYDFNFNLPPWS